MVKGLVVPLAAASLAVVTAAACDAGQPGGRSVADEEETAEVETETTEREYVLRGTYVRRFRGGTYAGRSWSRAEVAAWVGCVDLGGAVAAVLDGSGEWIGARAVEAVDDCRVTFTVEVPRAARYKIMIASFEGPTYSFGELERLGFRLRLSETVGPAAIDASQY